MKRDIRCEQREGNRGLLACLPCFQKHLSCSLTGKGDAKRGASLGLEDVRGVLEDVIRKSVTPEFAKIRRKITTLETELWNALKGVPRSGPDREWTEADETLKNWQLWGRSDLGYGHLPVVLPGDLERREAESEDVRGEPQSSSVHEEQEWPEEDEARATGEEEGDVNGEEQEDEKSGEGSDVSTRECKRVKLTKRKGKSRAKELQDVEMESGEEEEREK